MSMLTYQSLDRHLNFRRYQFNKSRQRTDKFRFSHSRAVVFWLMLLEKLRGNVSHKEWHITFVFFE